MSEVRIGVIGTGRIGKLHVSNLIKYVKGAKVIAVADIFIEDSREWAESMGIQKIYKDYQDLLNDLDIDAVVVACSTNMHAEVSIAAAEAGKAIFCEKPIAESIPAIYEVLAAVEKNHVKLQVGFNRRFDHNFKRVKDVVQSGEIGDPHIIRVTSRDPAPPPIEYVKVSGGLFNDMMIHDFDMVRYLSGSDVVEVTAHGAVLVDEAIGAAGDVDTAVVTLKMANGALAVIDNSRQAVYGYDQRVEVFGSKGQAVAYNDKPSTVEVSTVEGVSTDPIPYFFLDRYTGAFVNQFNDFIEAILENKSMVVDGEDGLKAVLIAKAAQQSMEENRPVQL